MTIDNSLTPTPSVITSEFTAQGTGNVRFDVHDFTPEFQPDFQT